MTEQGNYGNPWATPADSAGDEMQTDVMRFMAILGLCLVAIFALVQSLPLAPVVPQHVATPGTPPPESQQKPEKHAEVAQYPAELPNPVQASPAPVAGLANESEQPAVDVELPAPGDSRAPESGSAGLSSAPDAAPLPDLAASDTEPEGFTLRFDSDEALRLLVARGEVQFFGVSSGRAWRLAAGEQLAFVPSNPPAAFHEMTRTTIPSGVLRAFRRQVPLPSAEATWGVTLPDAMHAALQALLQQHRGGELIIMADGSVRLGASHGEARQ